MELIFFSGNSVRKIYIKGRVATMITPELGFAPVSIDLDKLELYPAKVEDPVEMDILRGLKTEEEMAEAIIQDFKKTGWRLIKKNGTATHN